MHAEKQHEKKEKTKDEVYYVQKIEDIHKINPSGKVLLEGEDDRDDGYVEVWSTYLEDKEVRRPTHGDRFSSKEMKAEKRN